MQCAIKKMDMSKCAHEKIIKSEIFHMKRFNHPNIVELKETFIENKTIWIVLELMDGGALMRVVTRDYKMSEPQIAHITRKVVICTH